MNSRFIFLLALLVFASDANCQNERADLYNCEGCEAIYEHSFDGLSWHTSLAGDDEPGEPLVISGIVYRTDGSTPAPDVIVYVYHTDATGRYSPAVDAEGWARRHGRLRGWMKTNETGRYEFATIRPAPYPGRSSPAHIHFVVKEPDRREYWIDSIHFVGDPLLTDEVIASREKRGGSGIISLVLDDDGIWRGVRDIVLER